LLSPPPLSHSSSDSVSSESSLCLLQSPLLSFGPNEICTLRQYLSSVNKQDLIPIECFFEILTASRDDWILCSQLFWRFRTTILSLVRKEQQREEQGQSWEEEEVGNPRASQLSLTFAQRSFKAFQTFVPTSFREYLFHRWRLIVFLFSFSNISHFPRDPFLLLCVSSLLTLHPTAVTTTITDSSLLTETSLIDSNLVIRTPVVAQHLRRLLPVLSTDEATETQVSVHLILHSPLELSLLIKCFTFLSAENELLQLHSLIHTSLCPQTDPSSFTSLFPTTRTVKQDRRRWRKFLRKYPEVGSSNGGEESN
jgi:hypothetical protein